MNYLKIPIKYQNKNKNWCSKTCPNLNEWDFAGRNSCQVFGAFLSPSPENKEEVLRCNLCKKHEIK